MPRVGNRGQTRSDRSFSYDRGVRTMPWAWHVRTRPYIQLVTTYVPVLVATVIETQLRCEQRNCCALSHIRQLKRHGVSNAEAICGTYIKKLWATLGEE